MKIQTSGSSDLPILFFIHGWPDSSKLWQYQVEEFQDKYYCICVTLPNATSCSTQDLSFEAITDDLIATIAGTLKKSPFDKVNLIGHDWGAVLAYAVEKNRPDLISSLITFDVGSELKFLNIKQMLFIPMYQLFLVHSYYLGRVSPLLGNFMTRKIASFIKAPFASEASWSMNYFYVHFWRNMFKNRSERVKVKSTTPLLYIYGSKKPFMFHTKDWLKGVKAEKNNNVVPIRAGHWMMLTHPKRVNRILTKWLEA